MWESSNIADVGPKIIWAGGVDAKDEEIFNQKLRLDRKRNEQRVKKFLIIMWYSKKLEGVTQNDWQEV